MRLIDEEKLMEDMQKTITEKSGTIDWMNMIYRQPTAYNVDKVVEQLEEERELSYADFDRYVDEVSPCLDAEYDDFFHRGLERAIKIVKGGGADAGGI